MTENEREENDVQKNGGTENGASQGQLGFSNSSDLE